MRKAFRAACMGASVVAPRQFDLRVRKLRQRQRAKEGLVLSAWLGKPAQRVAMAAVGWIVVCLEAGRRLNGPGRTSRSAS